MSIYIDGLDMPKSCFECPFMYARRYCLVNSKIEFNDADYSETSGRYKGCPLFYVPPNGDFSGHTGRKPDTVHVALIK